jgi:phosphosulfolactate synthase
VEIDEDRKADYVAAFADDFTVLSEVGAKSAEGNERLRPRDWARQVRTDLAHGARWVITEARESGTTGIAQSDGRARLEILDALQDAGVDPAGLLFEAPTKALQTHFVLRFGADVNLGNIAPHDVVAVETLRLGLRSDTMLDAVPDDEELGERNFAGERFGGAGLSRDGRGRDGGDALGTGALGA